MTLDELGLDKTLYRIDGTVTTAIADAQTPVTVDTTASIASSTVSDGTPTDTAPESITSGEIDGNISFIGGFIQSKNFVSGSTGWRLTAAGDFEGNSGTFRGSITAATGTIGGFSIGADYIRDAANSFGLASTVTGGDDVRFWAGDTFANRATAPFRVTEAGAITATSATITGTLTTGSTIVGTSADTAETRFNRLSVRYFATGKYSDFTQVTGGGTLTLTELDSFIDLPAASGSPHIYSALLSQSSTGYYAFARNVIVEFAKMSFINNLTGTITTGKGAMFGLSADTNSHDLTDLPFRAAFHISYESGAFTLYAVTVDAVAPYITSSVITGITLANANTYRIEFDRTHAECRFYVNEVLKATLTTHLPSTTDNAQIVIGMDTSAVGGSATLHFSSQYIVWENS